MKFDIGPSTTVEQRVQRWNHVNFAVPPERLASIAECIDTLFGWEKFVAKPDLLGYRMTADMHDAALEILALRRAHGCRGSFRVRQRFADEFLVEARARNHDDHRRCWQSTEVCRRP